MLQIGVKSLISLKDTSKFNVAIDIILKTKEKCQGTKYTVKFHSINTLYSSMSKIDFLNLQ